MAAPKEAKNNDVEEKQATPHKKKKSKHKHPPIQMVLRDKTGWRYYKQDNETGKLRIISDTKACTDADIIFSDDGNVFAVLLDEGVQIYKSSKAKLITFLKCARVRNVYFSPLNTFIITYHHQRKDDKDGNCWLWKWSETEYKLIYQFFVSSFNKKAVPFAFSDDEFIAAQISNNIIIIHDTKQSQHDIIGKMDIPKAVDVVIAPSQSHKKKKAQKAYLFAVFAKATSTKAATVTIYEYQYKTKESKPLTQLSQRQFFGVDECILLWDTVIAYHHSLLVIASSDIDSFGQSYYGNQELFLMCSSKNGTIKISDKIQDVAWHPLGQKEFVLIDKHPQEISIYDDKGTKVHSIGEYARNIVRFSKCGRFLWVGGFGNLTGEMTFYDYIKIRDNECEILKGYNRDRACRYFEWSPDSSMFITARIYPNMQVDNGFSIYKYNGIKLYEENMERLYQIAYRPNRYSAYPQKEVSAQDVIESKSLPQKEEVQKTRYVPPHLRNKGSKSKGKGSRKLFR